MKQTNNENPEGTDANRDPISGAPGAHPVGTGLGAAGGGAAGAALGAVAGPVGAAVGLVAGAIAGGLGGKGVAEQIDPTTADAYWREQYSSRSYVDRNTPYETYAPAYRTGYTGRSRYPEKSYEEAEADLRRDYDGSDGSAQLGWEKAQPAVRDAWHHVDESLPGDRSNDVR